MGNHPHPLDNLSVAQKRSGSWYSHPFRLLPMNPTRILVAQSQEQGWKLFGIRDDRPPPPHTASKISDNLLSFYSDVQQLYKQTLEHFMWWKKLPCDDMTWPPTKDLASKHLRQTTPEIITCSHFTIRLIYCKATPGCHVIGNECTLGAVMRPRRINSQ